MRFLSDEGLGVAGALSSSDGNLVETFDTQVDPLHVSGFTKASGGPLRCALDWHPEFHRDLGAVIGRMHVATRIYQRLKGIQKRKSWPEGIRFISQYIPQHGTFARRRFDEVVEWASSFETGPDTFGLVHIHPNFANLFVGESSGVTAFDFDDCHYNWFAYDLEVPIFYALVHFGVPSPHPTEQNWFSGPVLDGYTRHNIPGEGWLRRVPAFVGYRRIEVFAWTHKLLDMGNLADGDIMAMRRIRDGFLAREALV